MHKNTQKMRKNRDKTGLKRSRLYYRVLVMFMETLGKVTHLVSSQNGQKCAKIHQKGTEMVLNLVQKTVDCTKVC